MSLRTVSHTGRADKTPQDTVTGADTASCRTTPAQQSLRVYNKLNLQHVQSPVARYIHQIPSPSLIKNVRPPVTTGHVTPARGRHHNDNNNNNTVTASSLSSHTVSADKLSLVSSVSGAASCCARDENTEPCSNSGASSLSSTSTSKCATLVSTAPRLPRVNYVSSGRSVVAEKNWSKAVDCLEPAQSLVKSNPGVCVSVIRHHGKKRVPASRVDSDNKVTAGAVQVSLLRRSLSHDHGDSTPMVDVSVVDVKSAVSARAAAGTQRAVGTRKPC